MGLVNANQNSINSGGAATTGAPSSTDDWFAAVCKPGTFNNGVGHGLANADAQGMCMSRVGVGAILSGQYSQRYMADNDAAFYAHMGSSASITTNDGRIQLFVAMSDRSGASLQPLAQYGFTIVPAH
jgi:hypothetical protein